MAGGAAVAARRETPLTAPCAFLVPTKPGLTYPRQPSLEKAALGQHQTTPLSPVRHHMLQSFRRQAALEKTSASTMVLAGTPAGCHSRLGLGTSAEFRRTVYPQQRNSRATQGNENEETTEETLKEDINILQLF